MHDRRAKMKLSSTLAKDFVCEGSVEAIKGILVLNKKESFNDQMILLKSFCHSGDRLKPSGGS